MIKHYLRIWLLGPLLCGLLLFSCATTPDTEGSDKADARSKLGVAYLNNGQLNEAFIEFQKAIQLDPAHKESLNYLGYINTRYKKYEKAISYYERAISADPDYSEALNNLGVTYAELGNWDEAIEYFKRALRNPVYQTPARAFSNMGYAYYKKGDYLKAKEALREALMRNPVISRAVYILGLVHVKLQENEAAIVEFEKAIGMNANFFEAHWELANAYVRSGEKDKALEHFKVVAEKDQNIERSREALEYIELLEY